MSDKNSDLEYVSSALKKAGGNPCGYPMIYCLWGAIVFLGYAAVEFYPQYATAFWIVACPVGGLLSWWLAERGDRAKGQADKILGMKYMWHFLVMAVFLFTAMFTRQYVEILLLVGMGYSLAGLYLDKIMHSVGALALLVYLAIHVELITSPLFVGAVLAAGFFVSAWAANRANKQLSQAL